MTTFGSMGDTASLLASAADAAAGSARAAGRLNTTAPLGGGAASGSGGDSGSGSDSAPALSSLTVLLMGADPDAVAAAEASVRAALAAAVQAAGGAAGGLPAGVLQRPYVNVLPIPGPGFGGDAMGLQPTSNYFTLLLRTIAPGPAGAAGFAAYAAQQPLRAWRLTPAAPGAPRSSSNSSSYPLPTLIPRQAAAPTTDMGVSGGREEALDDAAAAAAAAAASLLQSTPVSTGGSRSVSSETAAPDAAAGSSPPAGDPVLQDGSSTPACLAAGCTQLQALAAATAVAVGGAARMRASVLRLGPQVAAFERRASLGTLQPNSTARASDDTETAAGGAQLAGAAAAAEEGAASSAAADVAAGSSSGAPAAMPWRGAGLVPLAAPPTLQEQQRLLARLMAAVDRRFGGSYALAHGFGAASALSLLGVDSGLDCLVEELNWCNGALAAVSISSACVGALD